MHGSPWVHLVKRLALPQDLSRRGNSCGSHLSSLLFLSPDVLLHLCLLLLDPTLLRLSRLLLGKLLAVQPLDGKPLLVVVSLEQDIQVL